MEREDFSKHVPAQEGQAETADWRLKFDTDREELAREYRINIDFINLPDNISPESSTAMLADLRAALAFYGSGDVYQFISSLTIDGQADYYSTEDRGQLFNPAVSIPLGGGLQIHIIIHELVHARDFVLHDKGKSPEDKIDFFAEINSGELGSRAQSEASAAVNLEDETWVIDGKKVNGALYGFMTPYALSRQNLKEDLPTLVEIAYLLEQDPDFNYFDQTRGHREFEEFKALYEAKLEKAYQAGFLGPKKNSTTAADGQAERVRASFLEKLHSGAFVTTIQNMSEYDLGISEVPMAPVSEAPSRSPEEHARFIEKIKNISAEFKTHFAALWQESDSDFVRAGAESEMMVILKQMNRFDEEVVPPSEKQMILDTYQALLQKANITIDKYKKAYAALEQKYREYFSKRDQNPEYVQDVTLWALEIRAAQDRLGDLDLDPVRKAVYYLEKRYNELQANKKI